MTLKHRLALRDAVRDALGNTERPDFAEIDNFLKGDYTTLSVEMTWRIASALSTAAGAILRQEKESA